MFVKWPLHNVYLEIPQVSPRGAWVPRLSQEIWPCQDRWVVVSIWEPRLAVGMGLWLFFYQISFLDVLRFEIWGLIAVIWDLSAGICDLRSEGFSTWLMRMIRAGIWDLRSAICDLREFWFLRPKIRVHLIWDLGAEWSEWSSEGGDFSPHLNI